MKKECLIAFFVILLLRMPVKAEDRSETLKKIESRKDLIHNAARMFDVNEACLKAVIFVERTMNYDWKDDVLDDILAEAGLNSSLGFCQVKLKTAYWIENQINDAKSEFYPGDKYKGFLKISRSPEEIIKKLYNDSLNICYAAAYIKIIERRWESSNYSIKTKPEIIGTLFSGGIYNLNGKERIPKPNPKPNGFGRKVKEAVENIFRN